MGSGDKSKSKYRALKREKRRVQSNPPKDGKAVVFVCNEILKEAWVFCNEQTLTGIITFLTESGKEIKRSLVYAWFCQGIWTVKICKKEVGAVDRFAHVVSGENVDPIIVDRLQKMSKDTEFCLYRFIIDGNLPYDQVVECLYSSVEDKDIVFRVTYATSESGDKGGKIKPLPLSDDYIEALKHEGIARIYLILLEHFAGIAIDERVALGGIDRKEYQEIIKIRSKNPNLDPKTIARVLTRAAYEYGSIDGDSWECLTLMVETMLYQRKRLNPLATANQLEIAKGLLRLSGGKLEEDIGIKRRGNSVLLLYDKYGTAIPAYIGYMDQYYRNIDLEKVPSVKVKLGDSAEADFLRVLEQTFAFPCRETYVLLASVGDFYKFIAEEVHRVYGGQIEKRIMQMLPMAIGFFVVHAVLGVMASRGNPYAAGLLVIAKAVGWIMNFDMGIATIKKMNEAGRHFAMVETIHRRSPNEKGKIQLTSLSRYHLHLGALALIDAMAEVIAMGVFIAGGKAGQKLASATAARIKIAQERSKAKVEIYIENDAITKIRAIKGSKVVEIQTQSPKTAIERTTPTGKKLKSVDDLPPAEEAGPNLGRRQKAEAPKGGETVKPMDYKKYSTNDSQGRPASSEAVSGIPEQHLKLAIQIAKEQGVIVIFRSTNPRGVQHIINGHPPKGKDLIALNTDPVTGKVTAKTSKQYNVAVKKGYYILAKDGYAYNRSGQKLSGADGKPVKYDMSEKGKFGEATNREGQVIDPKTRKSVVGDYDVQDVIRPNSAGRNLALVPETIKGDVVGPHVKKFSDAFNSELRSKGDVSRIVHGGDAQFMQYRAFRKNAFKGEAIGILPDGRVVHFTQGGIADFYKAIGRSRLDMPTGRRLQPYKKD
jgi:hypothetical protein